MDADFYEHRIAGLEATIVDVRNALRAETAFRQAIQAAEEESALKAVSFLSTLVVHVPHQHPRTARKKLCATPNAILCDLSAVPYCSCPCINARRCWQGKFTTISLRRFPS
jgi:hypothetical protein